MLSVKNQCPLCFEYEAKGLDTGKNPRHFYTCNSCYLIFVDRDELPSVAVEKQRYDHHQNQPTDQGYLSFLEQILEPMQSLVTPEMQILDYGCGPNPVLAQLLNSDGFKCEVYDPFYYPSVPSISYDVVYCTETIEHFFKPATDFTILTSLLKSGGYLAIMTDMWTEDTDFTSWYYMRDITHVSYYHERTFQFIGAKWNLGIIYFDAKRCIILQKK